MGVLVGRGVAVGAGVLVIPAIMLAAVSGTAVASAVASGAEGSAVGFPPQATRSNKGVSKVR